MANPPLLHQPPPFTGGGSNYERRLGTRLSLTKFDVRVWDFPNISYFPKILSFLKIVWQLLRQLINKVYCITYQAPLPNCLKIFLLLSMSLIMNQISGIALFYCSKKKILSKKTTPTELEGCQMSLFELNQT